MLALKRAIKANVLRVQHVSYIKHIDQQYDVTSSFYLMFAASDD